MSIWEEERMTLLIVSMSPSVRYTSPVQYWSHVSANLSTTNRALNWQTCLELIPCAEWDSFLVRKTNLHSKSPPSTMTISQLCPLPVPVPGIHAKIWNGKSSLKGPWNYIKQNKLTLNDLIVDDLLIYYLTVAWRDVVQLDYSYLCNQ